MHFTQVFTALTLAGAAFAHPQSKPAKGLATAMKSRGREFIGTALTLRGNATEEAIARNNADFNSSVIPFLVGNGSRH
jgi:endo-1,4-beta-xylanase